MLPGNQIALRSVNPGGDETGVEPRASRPASCGRYRAGDDDEAVAAISDSSSLAVSGNPSPTA